MAIDYAGFALPKTGDTPKRRRARRRRGVLNAAAVDKLRVMLRYGGLCIAYGISPVCSRIAVDPHELVPVGRGGKRVADNRVPICRRCHREAQGRVGGLRLWFTWIGPAPRATVPNSLTVTWAGNGLVKTAVR